MYRMLLLTIAVALLAPAVADAAGRRGPCAALVSRGSSRARLAVLSAFPAETAPLVAATEVEETVEVDGRSYHLGTLRGVRVLLGLTGIGLVNAATRTESVLERFDVTGLVVSGVAGSPYRIGDVVVPTRWTTDDGQRAIRASRSLRALARKAARGLALTRCTAVPPTPPGPIVCLGYAPTLVLAGRGRSKDPFRGRPFECDPGGDEVFGCELPSPATAIAAAMTPPAVAFAADDMETAAIARVAAGHGVPWVAFRAVSDGAGDPLGLSGSFTQFFAYYRLAAENAASVTIALLERLARLGDRSVSSRRTCARLARAR